MKDGAFILHGDIPQPTQVAASCKLEQLEQTAIKHSGFVSFVLSCPNLIILLCSFLLEGNIINYSLSLRLLPW